MVLGCVFGLMLAAPASSIGQTPTRTVARIYSPFTPTGASRLPTVLRQGSCFAGSLAANRRDAWRCAVGNLLHDPCFKAAKSPDLICVSAPWSLTALRLKLTQPLPSSGNRRVPSLTGLPWALQLADGRRCRFITGATKVIGTRRLNYGCNIGPTALWGYPIRSRQPWVIYDAPSDATALTRLIAISNAWF